MTERILTPESGLDDEIERMTSLANRVIANWQVSRAYKLGVETPESVYLAKAFLKYTASSETAPPVADWYSEHTEAEMRREYQSATDQDAPDHIRGESFEKWAEAEGYIRGSALLATPSAIEAPHPRTFDLMDYIDALFVSGNEVPVTSTLLSKASWDIICEMCEEGLALDYHVVEAEAVYRRKLAAYGDETRATSPLKAWKEKHLGI